MAPELVQYEPLSLKTDIWSVGVLAYVLLSGFSPFGGDDKQETFLNITQCNLTFPDELFEGVSDDAIDFMKSTMRLKPWWVAKGSKNSKQLPLVSHQHRKNYSRAVIYFWLFGSFYSLFHNLIFAVTLWTYHVLSLLAFCSRRYAKGRSSWLWKGIFHLVFLASSFMNCKSFVDEEINMIMWQNNENNYVN